MFHTVMDFMKDSYHGMERLWRAFWIMGIGISIGTYIIGFILTMIMGNFGLILTGIIMMASWVFYAISIWKCGPNTDWMGWMYAARAISVLTIIKTLMFMIGLFGGHFMDLNSMFMM